jgi:hypothetical protein
MIYAKIERNGGYLIVPFSVVQDYVWPELESTPLEVGESISITAVEMSEEEVAALPEFDGF